jgi:hypothetical protein
METNKFKLIVIKQSLFKIENLMLLLKKELTNYKKYNEKFKQDLSIIQELFYNINIKFNQ